MPELVTEVTNRHNLPIEVYNALCKNRYSADESESGEEPARVTDFSVSTLIAPIQQTTLRRRYTRCNSEDAIDRVWTLFGHIAHQLLEEHGSDNSITEKRFYMSILGKTISGQIDHYKDRKITDYKTTSAYKIIKASFNDWQKQQNCYDDKTEVLTTRGWLLFKNLDKSDYVFSLSPETGLGYFQKPIAYQEKDFNGNMFLYENSQVSLCVTPEHNMFIKKPGSRQYELMEANKIINKRFSIKKSCVAKTKQTSPTFFTFTGQTHRKSKYTEPLNVEFSDFCEFMGWYLSEGWVNNRSSSGPSLIGISQDAYKNPDKCLIIESLLHRMNIKFHKIKSAFIFNDKRIHEYLKQFGKSSEKFIPSLIKEASSRDIEVFLTAYCLGDGSKNGSGYQIYTASKQMANDLQECILKSGYSSNILYNGLFQKNTEVYVVSMFKREDVDVIHRPILMPYNGKVYDISLARDHVFMVRRNGKSCWSGNCYATLCEENGLEVDSLRIVAIIRDWSESAYEKNYPEAPIVVIPLLKWSAGARLRYMTERVQLLIQNEKLPDECLTKCTPEERWMNTKDWAWIKPGAARATKTFDSADEAQAWAPSSPELELVQRMHPPRRCIKYCNVSNLCWQHATFLAEHPEYNKRPGGSDEIQRTTQEESVECE